MELTNKTHEWRNSFYCVGILVLHLLLLAGEHWSEFSRTCPRGLVLKPEVGSGEERMGRAPVQSQYENL